MNYEIYHGDCLERIKDIPDNSIHLVVSSPPYFNVKKYNGENNNIGNNKSYEEYLSKIGLLITQLYRVLDDGGYICWNTSPVLDNGKRYGIPFDTHKLFTNKFDFLEDIVHVKPSGAAKLRNGGWCQNNGRPTTWHANINTEYIMVYKKPGTRPIKDYYQIGKYYNPIPKDLLTCTWFMNPETSKSWHDAPFCEELAKRCILLYSYVNDTILDPFLGTGTVMKMARELERNCIGIELSEEYIEKAKKEFGYYQKGLFSEETYIDR